MPPWMILLYISALSTLFCCSKPVQSESLSQIVRSRPVSIGRKPPSSVVPKGTDVIVYFHDRSPDGSYVFGYILSNGERRYEVGTKYNGGLTVQGFYSYRKVTNFQYIYETTRYIADANGYYPSRVQVSSQPPKIPSVDYKRSIS